MVSLPIITTGVNTTTVVMRDTETVIDWQPFDTGAAGIIDILPVGNTITFSDPAGALGDFTVLNRILPVDGSGAAVARAIQFNGSVISRIVNDPGGHVWFYSPTGIIVGPTGMFDVGSLILTTNDIAFIPDGGGIPGSIYKAGGQVQFFGPASSFGFVWVQAGADISATGNNAYVALVAPRVTQAGSVFSNGQVAYLAAEQLEMTINGGLFDFRLTVGSEDGNGIVHTGTTTGPASTSAADTQRISMVALPKNDAMTMLLSGTIGYTPAASAAVEGSSIVLAAGFDSDDPTAVPANRDGSIRIEDTVFRNPVTAYATDSVELTPLTDAITFENEATIYAVNQIDVIAQNNETIDAQAGLTLQAGQPGLGGIVNINALGSGQVNVGGTFFVNATPDAARYDTVTPYLDGIGGTISVVVDAGQINSAVLTQLDASGIGEFGGALGGDGVGGTIDVLVEQNGVIATPELTLLARGFGGDSDAQGGSGSGGTINVLEFDGQLDVGILRAYSGGGGGNASLGGGDGTGGSVNIEITGQAQGWDELIADASGSAGFSFGTGPSGVALAQPDAIRLAVGGTGSLAVTSLVSLTANSFSGFNGAPGFTGQAGGILVQVTDGASLSTDVFEAFADAAFAGDLPAIDPDTTPTQLGGTVDVIADGGTIAARAFTASADAYAHAAAITAGNATGGTVQVASRNGSSIQIRDPALLTPGQLLVSASGYGGVGPSAPDVTGGTARLIAEDGSISVVGDAVVTASGSVGAFLSFLGGGNGHNAFGGLASVELLPGTFGTASISATNLAVLANGDARGDPKAGGGGGSPLLNIGGASPPPGDAIVGNSGAGIGGAASLTIDVGTLTAGQLLVQASGIGGTSDDIDAPFAFQSGDGIGGISTLFLNGGTTNVTTMVVASDGLGGGGAPAAGGSSTAALAGEGIGGTALANFSGGVLSATDTIIEAFGTGGAGMSHTGSGDATDGGDGNGGIAVLQSAAGATGSFTTGTLAIRANGIGGNGGTAALGAPGNGGNGFGLSASTDLADGAFSLGAVTIEAIATGGTGAIGGAATGGFATFALNDTAAGPAGARTIASLSVDSTGAGAGGATGTAGLTVLEVNALDPTAAVTIAGNLTLTNLGSDAPAGDGITATVSGAPLAAGGDIAMTTVRDLAIDAGPGLLATGQVNLNARSITATGLVSSGGAMSLIGPDNIFADQLSSGGTTLLQAVNGALIVANLQSVGDVTALALSVDIRSLGGLQFASADATAGDLYIETVGNLGATSATATGSLSLRSTAGNIASGDLLGGTWIDVDAGGAVTLGNLDAAIDIAVAARGGNLTVGDVTAGDEIWLSIFGTNATRVLTAGNLVSTGLGADGALGPPAVFGAINGGAGPTGNVTRVRSSGSIVVGDVQTAGRAILVADNGTTTAGNLAADEAAIVLGRGNIALGSVTTPGLFYVADSAMFLPNLPDAYDPASIAGLAPTRTAGGLTISGAVNAANITIGVGGTASAPSWTTPGRLLIDAGGQFTSPGATSAGGIVSIIADGGIGLSSLTSGGTTLLRAINGAVNVASLTSPGAVTAFGGSVDIVSPGVLTFADLDATAGGARVVAGGNLNLATADATGALTLDVGGTAAFAGAARAATISVIANDIAVGTTGSLGARGQTTALTLVNRNPARVTYVGGAANPAGFSLDQTELTRLFSDGTTLIGTALTGPPPPAGQGTVVVDDLALTFGGAPNNIGTGGELEISTQGRISIIGDVALRTSGANDTFTLDPSLIELDTALGSIAMLDGTGNPLGRLAMVGNTIAIATTTVLPQLATLTDFAAIHALLNQPGGNPLALRAGTMSFSVTNGLFIQNSGATELYRDRRGFTANGTVAINTASGATRISVNGQILTAGGPLLGLDTQTLMTINGAAAAAGGQFDPASTINGCAIGARCAPPPGSNPPSDTDLTGPVPSGVGEGPPLVAPLIELAGTEPLIAPPLVDEPITGVGNDDLWLPRCDEGGDAEDCPEPEGQQ